VAKLLRPPEQPIRYYVETESGKPALNKDLVGYLAQDLAEKIKTKIQNTQLRRFYSPVVALRDRAMAARVEPEQLQAELALLKARVAYAYERPGSGVPSELVEMFSVHAASVRTREDFIAFARHFEAVVAYHRALAESAKKEQRHG
jgi:CRISPR-associated protein Csm2